MLSKLIVRENGSLFIFLACPINVNFSQGAFVVTSIKAGLGVINFDTNAASRQRFFRRQFWSF